MEWLSVKVAHVVIADSRAVKTYLEKSYKAKNVVYISYGARELINLDITPLQENEILNNVGLYADEYYLEVARIVAENNIHLAIDGFRKSKSKKKLAVVGNFNLKDGYTKYLIKQKYNDPNIVFLDPIFDKTKIGIIRKNCYGYIHSYSSGGTNPSLLEQMVFRKPIMAYDVAFQREVLHGGGLFFKDGVALASCIEALEAGRVNLKEMADWQTNRIKEEYNWEYVAEKYSILFRDLLRHDK